MASNALITITYSVAGEKQREFGSLIRSVVDAVNAASGVKLTVYEDTDELGTYVEVYECDSIDTYDSLEDNLDDNTSQAIRRIATEFATARQKVMTLRRMT
jgi:hypothetical protein